MMRRRRAVPTQEAGARLRSARRVLLIKPHHKIGDLLLATPILRNLRIALPEAEIVFLAGRQNAAAVLDNPDLDEVIVVPMQGLPALATLPATLFRLRRRRFDVALVLSTLSQSRTALMLARWCGAGVLVGLDDIHIGGRGREVFDCVLPCPEPGALHLVDHGLLLLEGLGIPVTEREHVLGVTGEQSERGRQVLAAAGVDPGLPLLGLQPGGATRIERRWSPAHYAEIARRAREELGCQVVLIGLREDRGIVDEVQDALPERLPEVLGAPFPTYKGVLRNLTMFLTHDGGPAHIAAGIGVPTFIVFRTTRPIHWSPYGSHVHALGDRDRDTTPDEVWQALRSHVQAGR